MCGRRRHALDCLGVLAVQRAHEQQVQRRRVRRGLQVGTRRVERAEVVARAPERAEPLAVGAEQRDRLVEAAMRRRVREEQRARGRGQQRVTGAEVVLQQQRVRQVSEGHGRRAMWADVGGCGQMWADVGRCGEMWGDVDGVGGESPAAAARAVGRAAARRRRRSESRRRRGAGTPPSRDATLRSPRGAPVKIEKGGL